MCRQYEKGLQAYLRAVDLSGASSVMLSKNINIQDRLAPLTLFLLDFHVFLGSVTFHGQIYLDGPHKNFPLPYKCCKVLHCDTVRSWRDDMQVSFSRLGIHEIKASSCL